MKLDACIEPCATRTVKPRKPSKPCTRPILAIDPNGIVRHEHSGYASFDEYMRNVVYLDPHIVVCYSPETWLWKMHERWKNYPAWSWRVAVTTKHGRPLLHKRVAYYGFRDPRKKRNRYHLVLDANSFFRKQDANVDDLLKLGCDIREFCNAHNLEVRASAAGIAAQFLRHPAFYPFARRRVPHFINEEVRPYLPGGYYAAYATPGQRMTASLYVDQESAHHYAAQTTPLPNANSVRAIGYTRSEKPYARKGGPLYEKELRKHGLIKASVDVPSKPPDERAFLPPLMQRPGRRTVYVWTNELPLLESLGVRVQHLIAVWGTEEVDDGIAKYAQWAREVGKRYPAMKALLLMPYGLLARHRTAVTYHHPGNGTDTLILANQRLDDTRARSVVAHAETANALQLGLIQAFVRALSLDMARQITAHGHEVVSIYADGIFVKLTKGKPVPLFAPWRTKGECLIELDESLRVPVRAIVRREYQSIRLRELTR